MKDYIDEFITYYGEDEISLKDLAGEIMEILDTDEEIAELKEIVEKEAKRLFKADKETQKQLKIAELVVSVTKVREAKNELRLMKVENEKNISKKYIERLVEDGTLPTFKKSVSNSVEDILDEDYYYDALLQKASEEPDEEEKDRYIKLLNQIKNMKNDVVQTVSDRITKNYIERLNSHILIDAFKAIISEKKVEFTFDEVKNHLEGNEHFEKAAEHVSKERLLGLYKQYVPVPTPKTPVEIVIEKLLAEREANMKEEANRRR